MVSEGKGLGSSGWTAEKLRGFLLRNWMTHDALWYGEVAARFGMAEASPMNLRVCRSLGRMELRRLLREAGLSPPHDMESLRDLFLEASAVFVPPFFSGNADFGPGNRMEFRTEACFAHKGMSQVGLIDEYACGIFERICGWFDAMEVQYVRSPDLSRCLKHRGLDCVVTFEFTFA